jgi:ABC-type Na+ efflux pump permease subunit
MASWVIAKKEFRILLRDRRAAVLLLAMPLLFILILGLLLGESFGQKPDDRIRIMIVDMDQGPGLTPGRTWSEEVKDDLKETAGIRIEVIDSVAEAERLVREHKQAAVLIFEPSFGEKVTRCSFLTDGINPFHRDGVYLDKIGARLLKDDKQPGQAAIIEQVAQVTLLRVILPYMIGKAFEKMSEPQFIELLGNEVRLPVPRGAEFLFRLKGINPKDGKASLNEALQVAAPDARTMKSYQEKVGAGVQKALSKQFENYNLTGKTWAALTRAQGAREGEGGSLTPYQSKDGSGLLRRGALRYQLLVPSYTVMFAFFVVLTVGWLFVAERRQGTLKRLQAAPVRRSQILLGKFLPCLVLSLGQGIFLLAAGKLVFGMRWGPDTWPVGQQIAWLLAVAAATSLSAVGLAMLVASLARTEAQVALFGAIPVLVLALIGGCVLPREMMPENTQAFTLLTPHGWALDAYRELLVSDPQAEPNLDLVTRACLSLTAFGAGFTALAWGCLKLE